MWSIKDSLRYKEDDQSLSLEVIEKNGTSAYGIDQGLIHFIAPGKEQYFRSGHSYTPSECKLMTLLSFCLSVLDANGQMINKGTTIKSTPDNNFKTLSEIANEIRDLLNGEKATTITEMTIEYYKEKMNNCKALGEKVGYQDIKAQEKIIFGDNQELKVYDMFYQLQHEIDNIRSSINLAATSTEGVFNELFPNVDVSNREVWYDGMRKQLIYKMGIDKGIIYTERNDNSGPLNISNARIIHAVLKSSETFPGQEVTYVKNEGDQWTIGKVNDEEKWVAGDVTEPPTEDFEFYAISKLDEDSEQAS